MYRRPDAQLTRQIMAYMVREGYLIIDRVTDDDIEYALGKEPGPDESLIVRNLWLRIRGVLN